VKSNTKRTFKLQCHNNWLLRNMPVKH